MENLNQPTFLDGRYRLDRLVVAHDDVTIWNATDMARGISVQLSIFERGSSVLHQGKSENGMFVAIDSSPSSARLELVDEEEDAFVPTPREPYARRRAWPWAVAGLAFALMAAGGWYVARDRSHPVASETTITAAQIPAVIETAPPAPIVTAVAPPVETPIIAKPVAAPARHETPVPRAKPQLPKPAKPRSPAPASTSYDPLTI